MCFNNTLFAALKFEWHMNFTCHEILFILFILYPPSVTICEQGCWLDLDCGLWLAGSSFSLHDLRACVSIGRQDRDAEGQVTSRKTPLLYPPSSSPPRARSDNIHLPGSPGLDLLVVLLRYLFYRHKRSFNLAICKGLG